MHSGDEIVGGSDLLGGPARRRRGSHFGGVADRLGSAALSAGKQRAADRLPIWDGARGDGPLAGGARHRPSRSPLAGGSPATRHRCASLGAADVRRNRCLSCVRSPTGAPARWLPGRATAGPTSGRGTRALWRSRLPRRGTGGTARRIVSFLRDLDLGAGARFYPNGTPVDGRDAQGDAAGWIAAAASATGLPSGPARGPWQGLDDYQENGSGDFLANAIASGAPRIRALFETPSGTLVPPRRRSRIGAGLGRCLGGASLLPSSALSARAANAAAARRTQRTLGIVPSEDWDGGTTMDPRRPRGRPGALRHWASDRAALRLIAELRRAATPAGMLPERVDAQTGVPSSTTPLASSHASRSSRCVSSGQEPASDRASSAGRQRPTSPEATRKLSAPRDAARARVASRTAAAPPTPRRPILEIDVERDQSLVLERETGGQPISRSCSVCGRPSARDRAGARSPRASSGVTVSLICARSPTMTGPPGRPAGQLGDRPRWLGDVMQAEASDSPVQMTRRRTQARWRRRQGEAGILDPIVSRPLLRLLEHRRGQVDSRDGADLAGQRSRDQAGAAGRLEPASARILRHQLDQGTEESQRRSSPPPCRSLMTDG